MQFTPFLSKAAWLASGAAAIVGTIEPASAQRAARYQFDLPAQPLSTSIRDVSAITRRNVAAASKFTDGKRAPAIAGRYTIDEVLALLLAGTGLQAFAVGNALVIRPDSEQHANPTPASEDAADIVVTGTRIRGAGPVGSHVQSIDRRQIEQSGRATVQDLAQAIPQNYGGSPNEATVAGSLSGDSGFNTSFGASVNLRGLGAGSTLVLLNGDRPALGGFSGVFADLSMIPVSAVERIEVVADGASAIYGSDAVAGVVNIIPRISFKGAETSLRVGTADGESQDIVASQIIGKAWSTGHAVLSYEYYRRTRLAAADRRYATDDLRAFGGADYRDAYASPGTIVAGDTTFAIPRGQNGVGLKPSVLVPGTVNLGDSWYKTDLLPTQTRHSAFLRVDQSLTDRIRFYAQGLYTFRAFSQRSRPVSNSAWTVPVANPFYVDPIGTRQPVDVQYSFVRDLGPETTRGSVEGYATAAGLNVDLRSWKLDLHGTWGRQAEDWAIHNRVNATRLDRALADTNPATAYNLFGDGPSTNPATIASVRGSTATSNRGTVWSATVRGDGPLFALPAGDLRLAVGAEYREERYRAGETVSDTRALTPIVLPAIALPGPRRIGATYGEVRIPVFGGDFVSPAMRRLDLSVALRAEHYSDVGSTTNPKVGFSWEPLSGLSVRGSYGRSFRAPSFNNLRQDPGTSLYFAYRIPDPSSPGGTANVLVLRGNDPDLRPERATTWTAGFDLKPAVLPGFHASLTYYDVDYRDRIASPAANLFNFLVNRSTYQGIINAMPSSADIARYYASPIFLNPFNIAPNAISAIINARLQNLSSVHQNGLDFDTGYDFPTLGGRTQLGVDGTYIFHIRQRITPDAPVTDAVGTIGNPVDLRLRARASWSGHRLNAAIFANYTSRYTNTTLTTPQRVAPWTTVDVQIGYDIRTGGGLLDGTRIALSATNVFDRDPPYVAYYLGTYVAGYDADNASPLGRVVALQITKSW